MDKKKLNAVKYAGGITLSIGIILFFIGIFESSYNILTSIGMGTIMGSVFIFLIGIFLIISDVLVDKNHEEKPHIQQEFI